MADSSSRDDIKKNLLLADFPGRGLEDLLARQAGSTPHREAVIGAEQVLTYGQLEARAERLAGILASGGAGPETLVAVCLDRSQELPIALYAVLKTGAAYVPLDPAYPRERLDFIIQDARAVLVITQEKHRGLFPRDGRACILIDGEGTGNENPSSRSLREALDARRLAYAIYTSGSTGFPKGVAVTHGSILALLEWSREVYSDAESAGCLASTSICFDLSVFELFMPLCRGGTVVLVDNILQLPRLPARNRVRLINTVPSAAQALLSCRGFPSSVTTVNVAGEPLKRTLVDGLFGLAHVESVLNLYGPSEDTVYSTWARIDRGGQEKPSIGRAVTGTEAHILDARFALVAERGEGELYLSGAGLSRGYYRRPQRTAERFVPNPFGGEPGRRMYATGDLVRLLANGELDFLSRLDDQVKLRGFRIELGEINEQLSRNPAVEDAYAAVIDSVSGEPCLVAYVTPSGSAKPDAEALRAHLARRLPDYMLPSFFFFLDRLPRTPNGKVDPAGLPEPDWKFRSGQPPGNELERLLSAIWSDVLGFACLDVATSFASLGGHSLHAIRILSRILAATGVELRPADLFRAGGIAELAGEIGRKSGLAREPGGEPLLPTQRLKGPLSFAQQALWFLAQLHPKSGAYLVPVQIRLTGALDPGVLQSCLEILVTRHRIMRTAFGSENGKPYQRVESFPIPRPRPLAAPAGEGRIENWCRERMREPFDLAQAPLWRVGLFRRHDHEHILCFIIPHILIDHQSVGILIDELRTCYGSMVHGRAPALPDLSVEYLDFAVWQRSRLRGGRLDALLAYWKRQLSGAPYSPELPADFPNARATSAGMGLTMPLDPALHQELKLLAAAHRTTLFIVLLTGFKAWLAGMTGKFDVVIGTALAGRDRPETEPLLGLFVNMLVLRSDLSGNPSFSELLERVDRVAMDAFAHREMPFDLLVEALLGKRDSETPFFALAFGMWNRSEPGPPRVGLDIHLAETRRSTSRYPLTVWMEERAGGLLAHWTFCPDMFSRETVGRWHQGFRELLQRAVKDPDQTLARIGRRRIRQVSPFCTGEPPLGRRLAIPKTRVVYGLQGETQ